MLLTEPGTPEPHDRRIRGACPLDCPDSCSLAVTVSQGKVVDIDGSMLNRPTAGYICAKVRNFGDRVYESVIPRNVRVSEAPSHGKPVLLYDLKCSGSRAYMNLASEVLRREGDREKHMPDVMPKAVGE